MTDPKNVVDMADILRSLSEDALWGPIEFVREELEATGPSAEERHARADDLIGRLLRAHKRDAWQRRAQKRRSKTTRQLEMHNEQISTRARELVETGHPNLQLACAGRSADAMTEEELLSIAEDLARAELLGTLEETGDDE